ncbi:MAG: long-chain-fatty-acid--CoA ligase [Proteobacteria bacterium]|nr:long-chain-fatty-acid--CoA ligase [Pseudomonadota bacterium]MBU1696760.1 long-chain-fatty-acid--CoA ligase [Pseudomonadota bacterium]
MQVLGDIPRLNARRYPHKNALVMDNQQLTFKQINDRANRLAHGLISLGVAPGDRVALLAENCIEFVIVNYAAAKCGAILVPINFHFKKKELIYVVNDSEPCVLFYGPEFPNLLAEAKKNFEPSVLLVAISSENFDSGLTMDGLMSDCSVNETGVAVDPNSPAAIMYTSGTTGVPKGVLFSHNSYLNLYSSLVIEGGMTANETVMVGMPMFHNGGLNGQLQPALMMGNTTVIMKRGFDPDYVLDAVARYRVTMVLWVPTQLAMLAHHPNKDKYDVSSMQKIWYGSSPITPDILAATQDFFKADFYQWFGQTETGMLSVLKPEDHKDRAHYTGREMFNAEMRIVNKQGDEVAPGEVGEIISTQKPLGMLGYHNKIKATSETIRNGWIYTGDLARAEELGYFTIVGRSKDMIISGAENIYPKEIEDIISSHSLVREAVVIGIPDKIWGESVCAVLVPKENNQLSETDIIEYCSARLSGYKKPKKVVFMDELPKNAAGKVMKHILRGPFWKDQGRKV